MTCNQRKKRATCLRIAEKQRQTIRDIVILIRQQFKMFKRSMQRRMIRPHVRL